MADVQETHFDVDEDSRVAKIKKELEGWREVLLPINKMLTWDKPIYPGILVGAITFIFISVWYLEPSVLTTFSLLGLTICLVDYLVPMVSASLFKSTEWTGVQEREFENICIRIHNARVHFHNLQGELIKMKHEKPKTHFIIATVTLTITAWIGSLIDNLLLTYLIVVFLVLLPGMRQKGLIQKYLNQAKDLVRGLIQNKKAKRS